ncbi:hypothetical protein IOLA_268 [uncultured bacterium]|nr:hypothetical protein IOLA_268 [uncultured bacterium]
MQNIILILYYLICDIIYYIYIYFIPAIICTSININFINFKNIFRFPYFCVQFISDEETARQVFKLFRICNVDNFKCIERYSIGNVQQIYVYINGEENVFFAMSIIEEICKIKYKNLKLIIEQISNKSTIEDYFLLYVIFSTMLMIISRYSYFTYNNNIYLYFITSLIMLINSLIFYSNNICFKYNLIFPNNLFKFKNYFIYLILILSILYLIDILFIWLNIRKNNLYEKN